MVTFYKPLPDQNAPFCQIDHQVCGCLRGDDGCFPPGVQIMLADGTTKAIEEISVADVLWNPVKQEPIGIRRIVEGPEPVPVIELGYETVNLRLSREHPLPVQNAESGAVEIKQAVEASLSDRVLGADGNFHELSYIRDLPVEEGQRVINVLLDTDSTNPEDRMLLSDGIVSGDYILQRMLKEQRQGEQ